MSEPGVLPWKRRLRRLLSRSVRPLQARLRRWRLLAMDRLVLALPAQPEENRVAIFRLDHIGDFVLWLHAGKALAKFYRGQGKHVTLVANASWQAWAAQLNVFDEVIGVEEQRFRRDLRYRFRTGRRIRSAGFGTVLQPAFTRVLEGGESLIRLSGARRRIGQVGTFDHGAQGDRRLSDRWYTELIDVHAALSHEMQRNAAFTRAVTGAPYRGKVFNLRTHLDPGVPEDMAELRGRGYFVIFPGATFAGRLWPVEHYVEIARRLSEATGWVGVICGGRSEAAQANRMCAEATGPLLNLVSRTDLMQLGAVIAGAKLLVGNETSAVHIAAAVGTPCVCVLGGGHYGRFVPYAVEEPDGRPLPLVAVHRMSCFHCDWRCRFHPPKGSPVPCIESIGVEEVWAAINAALDSVHARELLPGLTAR